MLTGKAELKGKRPVPKKTVDKARLKKRRHPPRPPKRPKRFKRRSQRAPMAVHFRRPLTFRPARNPKFPTKINSSSQSYG